MDLSYLLEGALIIAVIARGRGASSVKSTGRTYIPVLKGEFLTKDEIQFWAQEFFLSVVSQVTPDPLYFLDKEVLPKYAAAFKLERRLGKTGLDLFGLSLEALVEVALRNEAISTATKSSPLHHVARELVAWGERFNLKGARGVAGDATKESNISNRLWPLVAALETIHHWALTRDIVPMFRHKPYEFPSEKVALPPIQLRTNHHDGRKMVEIDTPGWYVSVERESNFRRRVSADFKRWLDTYVTRRKESTRTAGLLKAPGKRDLQHFIWTAKYQIGGIPASNIAKEYGVTPEAARSGIEDILNLIGLEPRPGRTGPKRKKHRSEG
jgi:hypothetical protein